ncbi:MAG: hypothetical protein ABI585_06790 [Betaproteobacteria bacterium]
MALRGFVAAVAMASAVGAHAADPLPGKLAGTWTALSPGRTFVDRFSLTFDGNGAPGPVSGRIDLSGVTCGALGEPIANGTWDGDTLRFDATMRPGVNSQRTGNCNFAESTWVLQRKPGSSEFVGTLVGQGGTLTVRASP